MGTVAIVGMASVAIGSAISQVILNGMGKAPEAQFVDLAGKSILAIAALVYFAKVMKAIIGLG